MITRIEASKRRGAKYEWLQSYYLFSFANYFDATNLHFGILRVFNDDTINAYSGFDDHCHDNMEIVTIMLEGTLTHRDSMGNTETIKVGEVQRMSAGTGVIHAEKNLGDEPVHLFQLWFLPKADDLEPDYEQKDFSYLEKNVLTCIGSPQKTEAALTLAADAKLFLGEFEAGKTTTYSVPTGRGIFCYVYEGSIQLNEVSFLAGDQARILDESEIRLLAETAAKFVWIEVGGM